MSFQIIRNDITRVKADAIVNTANPNAAVGDGVDSVIYKTAGREKLLEPLKNLNVQKKLIRMAFLWYNNGIFIGFGANTIKDY